MASLFSRRVRVAMASLQGGHMRRSAFQRALFEISRRRNQLLKRFIGLVWIGLLGWVCYSRTISRTNVQHVAVLARGNC